MKRRKMMFPEERSVGSPQAHERAHHHNHNQLESNRHRLASSRYSADPGASTLPYSGMYPAMTVTVARPELYQPHRSFDDGHRGQRQPSMDTARRSLHAQASLPGLSSLLQSGSPQPPPPINASLANGGPRHHRTVSWSSHGSPTDSPMPGSAHWGHAAAAHWGHDQDVRDDVYGQYYSHHQRLSQRPPMDATHRGAARRQPPQYARGANKSPLGGSASTSSLSGDEQDAARSGIASSSSSSSTSGGTASKNSRYLREMDRRAILERLANGEKQAALAKEFQVSRAAICNLNKHRDEVMSRADENPFAKHPKKRKVRPLPPAAATDVGDDDAAVDGLSSALGAASTSEASSPVAVTAVHAEPPVTTAVHVVQSRAVQLLLTSLRNQATPLAEFRRCSERVMRLVVEDALALVPTKPVDVYLNDQVKVEGVGMEHAPCGISMEQRHCPMMDMFHLIEPDQPTGYVRLGAGGAATASSVTLLDAHLPQALRFHNVFLFDLVAASGESICATIQQLKDRGAVDAMLHVVALFVSSEVVATVQCKFPGVRIVTAQIDASLSKKTQRGAALDGMLTRFAQVYGDEP